MSKKLITAVAAATLGAVALSAPVMAEVSATGGLVSQYVFRGNTLGDAAANGSVDYTKGGLTAGVWGIDTSSAAAAGGSGQNLEVDFYLSYGGDISDDLSYSVGVTRYEYTTAAAFENEVNLGLTFSNFSLGVDLGEGDPNVSGSDTSDYTHAALGWAPNDTYSLTIASVTDDDGYTGRGGDYSYAEASAAGTVSELDVSFTVGVSSDDLVGNGDDGYMVLSASKSFDL